MNIPILQNHDPSKPIGFLEADGTITFKPGTVTHEWLPFGLGYRVLEQQQVGEVVYLLKIEVIEFSCSPAIAAMSQPGSKP